MFTFFQPMQKKKRIKKKNIGYPFISKSSFLLHHLGGGVFRVEAGGKEQGKLNELHDLGQNVTLFETGVNASHQETVKLKSQTIYTKEGLLPLE